MGTAHTQEQEWGSSSLRYNTTLQHCSIVGFTTMSKEIKPGQVMSYLNELFTAFDALVDTFQIYKVRGC